jgi:hypothetical protein
MVEHRPNRFLAMPPVVPAEVKRFAPCKNSFVAAPRVIDLEIPSFLKRGPATADEVGLLPSTRVVTLWFHPFGRLRESAQRTRIIKQFQLIAGAARGISTTAPVIDHDGNF